MMFTIFEEDSENSDDFFLSNSLVKKIQKINLA